MFPVPKKIVILILVIDTNVVGLTVEVKFWWLSVAILQHMAWGGRSLNFDPSTIK